MPESKKRIAKSICPLEEFASIPIPIQLTAEAVIGRDSLQTGLRTWLEKLLESDLPDEVLSLHCIPITYSQERIDIRSPHVTRPDLTPESPVLKKYDELIRHNAEHHTSLYLLIGQLAYVPTSVCCILSEQGYERPAELPERIVFAAPSASTSPADSAEPPDRRLAHDIQKYIRGHEEYAALLEKLIEHCDAWLLTDYLFDVKPFEARRRIGSASLTCLVKKGTVPSRDLIERLLSLARKLDSVVGMIFNVAGQAAVRDYSRNVWSMLSHSLGTNLKYSNFRNDFAFMRNVLWISRNSVQAFSCLGVQKFVEADANSWRACNKVGLTNLLADVHRSPQSPLEIETNCDDLKVDARLVALLDELLSNQFQAIHGRNRRFASIQGR